MDLYNEFTENLPLPGAMENKMKGGNNMSYTKKQAANAATEGKDIFTIDQVSILRAKEFETEKASFVSFDMSVRGIKIYGMTLRKYTNSEGVEGDMISFPSRKGTDGKYYDYVWFPISKELREGIINKVVEKLS